MMVPTGVKARREAVHGTEWVTGDIELAVDRSDPAALAVGDRNQLGAPEHPFFDAIAGEKRATARAIDRNGTSRSKSAIPPAWSSWACVSRIARQADPRLPRVREVGQDEIDAGHVGVGEHDPAVDDEDAIVDLDAEAVAVADLHPARPRGRYGLIDPSHEDRITGPRVPAT